MRFSRGINSFKSDFFQATTAGARVPDLWTGDTKKAVPKYFFSMGWNISGLEYVYLEVPAAKTTRWRAS